MEECEGPVLHGGLGGGGGELSLFVGLFLLDGGVEAEVCRFCRVEAAFRWGRFGGQEGREGRAEARDGGGGDGVVGWLVRVGFGEDVGLRAGLGAHVLVRLVEGRCCWVLEGRWWQGPSGQGRRVSDAVLGVLRCRWMVVRSLARCPAFKTVSNPLPYSGQPSSQT